MPYISPSSNEAEFNYYKQLVDNAQDELKTQRQKSREKEEQRISDLEEKYEAALQSKQSDMDETVENLKERSNETIERNREMQREELNKLKAQTYDRFGKYKGEEAEVLQSQLEDLKATRAEENKKYKSTLSNTEENYDKKINNLSKEHNLDLEQKAKIASESAGTAYSELKDREKSEYKNDKILLGEEYERLSKFANEEIRNARKTEEKAINDTIADANHKIDKAKETNDERIGRQQDRFAHLAEKKTKELSNSHAAETKLIRDQVRSLVQAQGNSVKSHAAATAHAVKEYENDWRTKADVASDAYERDLAGAREKAKEADKYFARLHNDSLKDKDKQYSDIISRMNNEHHLTEKGIQKSFDGELHQNQERAEKDRNDASTYLSARLEEAEALKIGALQDQAKAYQNTIDRNRLTNNEITDRLKNELNYKAHSSDVSVVSPAAEAAIRENVMQAYAKYKAADEKRNKDTIASMNESTKKSINEIVDERNAIESQRVQASAMERHQEKSELMQTIAELELMKDDALRSKDETHGKETDKMYRTYSSMLERQRRQYDEILQNQKNESALKMQNLRQELEFSQKIAQRAFAAKQNEMVRDYSKRIAADKAESDAYINEIKANADQALNESERKGRTALEDQSRAYEQKIAQMELQHKEKERYITQNYEDTIDRLKQTNALLIRKKS